MTPDLVSCWKCDRPLKTAEVNIGIIWWVGYKSAKKNETLAEQGVYRYCYPCARMMDFGNTRVFMLDKPRFQLEGALSLSQRETIAHCSNCRKDIFSGYPYGRLIVELEYENGGKFEPISNIFSWDYCTECAPFVDLDNVFILEAKEPLDLLFLAQSAQKQSLNKSASG